jgi:hypothetical protein
MQVPKGNLGGRPQPFQGVIDRASLRTRPAYLLSQGQLRELLRELISRSERVADLFNRGTLVVHLVGIDGFTEAGRTPGCVFITITIE